MRKRRRQSLHHSVVREIGQQILAGKWPIGEPLPNDAALCATLRISRTALREALIVLAAKGLVESRQKVGTLVRPREEWNMLDADILTWRVETPEGDSVIAELYELRKLIEPLAASLAAANATRRDLDRLRKAYDDMVAAGDNGVEILDPDVRFHRGVIAATGNSLFASVGLVIAAALEVNFQVAKDVPSGHAWANSLHKAVLDAIVARDSKAARVAMQKLLEISEEDLRSARSRKGKTRAAARTS